MSPEEFATCWVPVPLRWRHVVPGDVIVGKDGTNTWSVWGSRPAAGQWAIDAFGLDTVYGDPGEVVQVLTPVPMAQAVQLTREQIGMQLIERRNGQEQAA